MMPDELALWLNSMAFLDQLSGDEIYDRLYECYVIEEGASSSMSNSGSSLDEPHEMYTGFLSPLDYGPIVEENQYFDHDKYRYCW